jgi:hypothetical protein
MKTILTTLIVALWFNVSLSQQSNYFLVNLAINENSKFNKNNNINTVLYKKITELSNKVEGVIIDKYSDYYLVCDVYTTQSKTSNAGFLPVGSYKVNLKLNLIYKSGGKIFKQLNFTNDYAVNTEIEALENIVNDFTFTDSELNDFFIEGSKKMKKFYSENCNLVIESAKKYQSIGEPEKALAICLSIPSDVPCYNSISGLTKDLHTSLSYKSDYGIFLSAQDYVSKGDYESAFTTLENISIYSQFYSQAQTLSKQINDFIFNQKELQKKKELVESQQKLKETEIEFQQKLNELQASINSANIEIAIQKNQSVRQIAIENQENQRQIKAMEFQSQERKEMIKTAGNLLNSYINRPQPKQDTNFYIIR